MSFGAGALDRLVQGDAVNVANIDDFDVLTACCSHGAIKGLPRNAQPTKPHADLAAGNGG